MKAAVMYGKGTLPQYADFPEPEARSRDEIKVSVKAVAIKHFDKARASGRHYSADAPREEGTVPGGDGICLLADGRRVYGMGISGMLAEKAVIDKDRVVAIPDTVDDATAAALPNAVIGAAMALRIKAAIKPGDVVLINGATGFTGRVAVQLARHYGAGRVIATGRNERSLQHLLAQGADEVISVAQGDEQFMQQINAAHAASPFDIVIDYLWGHTAEMILATLKGDGRFTRKTRYVSVGSVTGDTITLSASVLRSTDLQLTGSGLGSWSADEVKLLFTTLLPEAYELAATGKLKVATISVALENIADLWDITVPDGQRIVVTM